MKSSACLLFIAVCITCTMHAQTYHSQSPYRFEHFDTKDGLSSDYALSVAQDSLGYIWVQSRDDLSRYDGYDFKVYKHDPDNPETSLADSELSWIYTDQSGDLWISPSSPTQQYLLSKYDRKTDGFIKHTVDLKGAASRRLRFDKSGKSIWFSTPKGLFEFNPETSRVEHYINIQKNTLEHQKANLTHDVLDHDSILLVGTAKGLWKFNKNKKAFGRIKSNAKDSVFLSTMPIIGIYKDQNLYDLPRYNLKELWLLFERDSTNELGLVKVDENFSIVQRFDFPGTLFGVRLMSLDRDKEGVFWISTWGIGICRYDPRDSSYVILRKIPGDPYSLRSDFVMGIIVELSREAGYSHIHFYRKIKALSGQTPNMFLRTIRLKRAAELLRNKSDNVSQIAYSVGFSSQSYFIKCFKEQFGMTPGEFVDSNKIQKS